MGFYVTGQNLEGGGTERTCPCGIVQPSNKGLSPITSPDSRVEQAQSKETKGLHFNRISIVITLKNIKKTKTTEEMRVNVDNEDIKIHKDFQCLDSIVKSF